MKAGLPFRPLVRNHLRGRSPDRGVTGWQDVGGPVILEVGEDLLIPYVPQICVEVDFRDERSAWNCRRGWKI